MTPPHRAAHPTPDLATVPATAWRDRLDEAGARAGLRPARAGIHLGTGRDGRPVALPGPGPGPAGTRIAVLGDALFGRLVALRLLAAGAHVTADTGRPQDWRWIRQAVRDRLAFTHDPARDPARWPVHAPAPPTVGAGPQALVSDRSTPPPAATASGPWRVVLHVTAAPPPRHAGFWHAPDALLALDAGHAEAVGRLLGADAARRTAALARGEVILLTPTTAEIARPDVSPGEASLLTPDATRQGG